MSADIGLVVIVSQGDRLQVAQALTWRTFSSCLYGKRGLNHQRVREMDLETGKRIGEEKKAREDRRVFIVIS